MGGREVAEVAPERDHRRGDRGLLNEPNIEANEEVVRALSERCSCFIFVCVCAMRKLWVHIQAVHIVCMCICIYVCLCARMYETHAVCVCSSAAGRQRRGGVVCVFP